ncbi:MAG: hypothetical protein IKH24_04850 [Bacteroidales bacterium]|nr:hypothetical protein [Bacteroidales bacterium]
MKRIQFTLLFLCAMLVTAPIFAQTLPQGPELPELMGLKPMHIAGDETDSFMEKTAWELVFMTPDQVKAFTAKLCNRANWARQILAEMEEGKRPEDNTVAQKLIDECKNCVTFLLKLGVIAGQHTNVQMKKTDQGAWTYEVTPAPEFRTNMWLTKAPQAKKKPDVMCPPVCMVNYKYYFCEQPFGGGNIPTVIDDDEMYVAQVSFVLLRNIGIVYESGALALLKKWYPDDQERFERTYQTCLLYLDSVTKAIENNDKVEIKYEPMPAAGKMNASMKAKVLPLEKAVTDKVVDCVVTSDGWKVETDATGTPIRRVIYGYSIVQTKRGKQATRVSWAEDYQGGGQYGALHAYGVGGAKFYVK